MLQCVVQYVSQCVLQRVVLWYNGCCSVLAEAIYIESDDYRGTDEKISSLLLPLCRVCVLQYVLQYVLQCKLKVMIIVILIVKISSVFLLVCRVCCSMCCSVCCRVCCSACCSACCNVYVTE